MSILLFWSSILKRTYRPPVVAVIAFAPPAVEYGAIRYTIDRSLHAACARSFKRDARHVQPQVCTRYEKFCRVHVIVLHEEDLPAEAWICCMLPDVANEAL